MNKKKLSVVMAGAMLASSVAPVLAAQNDGTWDLDATTGKKYEVNGSNRGTLVKDLRELLNSKVYADEAPNYYVNDNDGVSVAGQSVYAVGILSKGGNINSVNWHCKLDSASIEAMEVAINTATTDDTVVVIDRGHVVKNGKYYVRALEDTTLSDAKEIYTAATLKQAYTDFEASNKLVDYPAIESMDYDADNNKLTVHTRTATDELNLKTIELTVGSDVLEFDKPVDSYGDSLAGRTWNKSWNDLAGFEVKRATAKIEKDKLVDGKVLARVAISDVDTKYTVKLSDLYDGLLLTDKGQELLAATKEYVEWSTAGNKDLKLKAIDTIKDNKNGIFTFTLAFEKYSAKKNGERDARLNRTEVTVSSNNKAQLEILHKWLSQGYANVDVLAGDNRYETAVKVAKENAKIEDVAVNGNIVLVNGNALVDGLAAAPLAASVWNKGENSVRVAPILLTESNSLPKATKDYIRELIKYQTVGNLDKVTVYLVGGETVISKSLENQLKDFGLRVVRAGGDNREETSLKVAEIMQKDTKEGKVDLSNAFIVGGEGEADAMSIASVAAGKKQPIIVSKKSGLSEDALNTLVDWKNDKYDSKGVTATIIGGETAVSKETEEALEDKGLKVSRIGGVNRKATNAEVINTYYATNSVDRLVVSKDGQNNKSELIDTLTATSLAVKHHGPIVLATNKLSADQINALEKKTTRTRPVYAYQVGHGVSRDVLKTIAQRLNLAK